MDPPYKPFTNPHAKPGRVETVAHAERINARLRRYQIQQTATWDGRAVIRRLHRFFGLINDGLFEGSLTDAVISLQRTRGDQLGHYVRGRNEFGLRHNINLNAARLDAMSTLEQLVVLVHEQCHQWQELFGAAAGTPQYHNREFCDKAESIGLIVHRPKGYTLGLSDPFLSLVRSAGVDDPLPSFGRPQRGGGRSKLRKWSCGCDPPVNLRVSVLHFDATCNRCGKRFARNDGRESGRRDRALSPLSASQTRTVLPPPLERMGHPREEQRQGDDQSDRAHQPGGVVVCERRSVGQQGIRPSFPHPRLIGICDLRLRRRMGHPPAWGGKFGQCTGARV